MNHPTPPPISEVRMTAGPRPLALVVGLPERAAMACARRLMLHGFVVARAATGPGACERAQALKPELIIVSRELWSFERRVVDETAALLGAVLVESPLDGDIDIERCRLAS
jgi:hypothetical protein